MSETAAATAIRPPAHSVPTPLDLLQLAVENHADLETLEKLMDLELRTEAERKRRAFYEDLAAFKSECPAVLTRDRPVKYDTDEGEVSYRHATLGAIHSVVVPLMSKHGLSHSWSVDQDGPIVRVTCWLKHRLGYVEPVAISGPLDNSGSKNGIQQVASSITYLSRYSLKCALGLSEEGDDDDGLAAGAMKARMLTEKESLLEAVRRSINTNWRKLEDRRRVVEEVFGVETWDGVKACTDERLRTGVDKLEAIAAKERGDAPATMTDIDPLAGDGEEGGTS